jgi:hypothetical protein
MKLSRIDQPVRVYIYANPKYLRNFDIPNRP